MITIKIRPSICHYFVNLCCWVLCLFLVFTGIAYAASSEEYLARAKAHLNKGEVSAAIIELKNSLQKNSKNAEARFTLGVSYLELGDGAQAEKELERAKRLGFAMNKVIAPLAKSYLLINQPQRILDDIKVDNSYPDTVNAELHVLYGEAYIMLNDFDKAGAQFSKALTFNALSSDARLGQARLAIAEGNFAEAKTFLNTVIEHEPSSSTAWTALGEIERRQGNFETAEKNLQQAIKFNASNMAAQLGLATIAISVGEFDKSLAKLDEIDRLVRNPPMMASYIRAMAYYNKKDLVETKKALEKVLRVAPNHIPSLQLMGEIHYLNQRFEQAEYALDNVVAAQPQNLAAVKLLGAVYVKLNQPGKAIDIMKPLAAKYNNDAQLMALLGSAYMRNRETSSQAMEYLTKAVELSPDAANIKTQLALAQLVGGKQSEAVEQLESAIELGPDLVQADILLILVHIQNKEFSKALAQANALQKKSADNPIAYNLTGAAYLGLKKRREAREQFQKALSINATFLPAMMNLARMDQQDDKIDAAKKHYQSVLKVNEGHVAALMSLGDIASKEGDTSASLNYVKKANTLNPSNPLPGIYLVQYYLRQNQALKALSTARQLNSDIPNNATILKALGMAQMAAEQKSNAVVTFNKLVDQTPKSPEGHYLLAKLYISRDEFNAAGDALDKALTLAPNHLPSLLASAQLAIKTKMPQDALKIAETIKKQHPKSTVGYILEGDTYASQQEFKKAARAYEDGFNKFKTSQLLIKLVGVSEAVGDSAKTVELLKAWNKEHADDIRVAMLLAGNYQASQNNKSAMKLYRHIVKLDPKNIVALNNLAWLLHLEKSAKSLEFAERAYKLLPKNPEVADTYGWLLVNHGDVNRGLILLQQAALQAPQLSEIRYHVAVAMHKLGRSEEAKKELEKILQKDAKFSDSDKALTLYNSLK
ncbi:MAG: PEP-CTERM system TPR-repeat protein PrsT [Gammaproteobacteria bacterium]|nr:PEP-CTERM system TPR-repeat protein PrsT [Gammaproteobacteria bacterium]